MARWRLRRSFRFTDMTKHLVNATVMREAGEMLATRIENRTLAGRDEDGRRFTPYSDAYRRSVKRGRSTVDLHGEPQAEMFNDFGVIATTRNTVSLGFRSDKSADKARWHETGAGRLPERRFLGVPVSWIRDIRRLLAARMKV